MKTIGTIFILAMATLSWSQELDVLGTIKISDNADTPQDGMIRYAGGDFWGYSGGTWHSFTGGGGTAASPWTMSTNGIEYNNVEVHSSTSNGRVDFASTSHVYQLSPEGATFTMRDDLTYKWGYYGPDELGPTQTNFMTLGSSTYRWKEIWSINALNTTSDRRLKKNIVPSEYGLAEILSLEPVQYKWKKGHDREMIGLIAQDVENVIPQVVRHNNLTEEEIASIESNGGGRVVTDENADIYSMSYTQLIPVLVNAIKELNAEIEQLKAEK